MAQDRTKELLEQLLADLYDRQRRSSSPTGDSYLQARNGQYLGKITSDGYDNASMLNEYGPYGSPYSTTSIFNEYSDYGSPYGTNSVNNPYCSAPPQLVVGGRPIGSVTVNPYVPDQLRQKRLFTFCAPMSRRCCPGGCLSRLVWCGARTGNPTLKLVTGPF